MSRKVLGFMLLLGAMMTFMAVPAFAQSDVSPPAGEVTQSTVDEITPPAEDGELEAAQQAARDAAASAASAEESADTAKTLAIGFGFLTFMAPWLWWPALIFFLLWDGFFLCKRIGRALEPDHEAEWFGMFFFLIFGLVGLHLFGVINLFTIVDNPMVALKWAGIQIGSGIVFAVLKGIKDLYFKYFKARERKLKELYTKVSEKAIAAARADHASSGASTPFDPAHADVKARIRDEWEQNRERKDLLRPLPVGRYVGTYVAIGMVWQLYVAWKLFFESFEQVAKALKNFGQLLANRWLKQLQQIGEDDPSSSAAS